MVRLFLTALALGLIAGVFPVSAQGGEAALSGVALIGAVGGWYPGMRQCA
jgi:hypothetical protein